MAGSMQTLRPVIERTCGISGHPGTGALWILRDTVYDQEK
jgi:hypothetical protein